MTAGPANTLRLDAHARGERTVVGTIRATGLLRASRPFAEDGAARVVVSHLGPGMVRGDAFVTGGRVAPGAHLIVTGQMATRVLSGPDPVTNAADWVVERDARLQVLAEPTLVAAGASYDARLTISLAPEAGAVVTELIRRERGAALRVATFAWRGERCAAADVLRFDAEDENDDAIGTLLILAPPEPGALDAVTQQCTNVRVGVGTLRDGDTLVRITGPSTWAVREALSRCREAAIIGLRRSTTCTRTVLRPPVSSAFAVRASNSS